MAETTASLADIIAQGAKPLRERRDALAERVQTLAAERDVLVNEVRQIDRILNLMESANGTSDTSVKGATPKKKKTAKGSTVAPWREDHVANVLRMEGRPMTVNEIAAQTGWKRATAELALKQARASQKIRFAGVRGDQRGTPGLYAAMEQQPLPVGSEA